MSEQPQTSWLDKSKESQKVQTIKFLLVQRPQFSRIVLLLTD